MSAAIPFHKQRRANFHDRSTVLAIGALMQFGAISWLFFTRFTVNGTGESAVAARPAPGCRRGSLPILLATPRRRRRISRDGHSAAEADNPPRD